MINDISLFEIFFFKIKITLEKIFEKVEKIDEIIKI